WRGGVYHYNRAVTNINTTNTTIINNTYNNTTIINKNRTMINNHASFNGGPGGVSARPNSAEQVASRERHFAPTSMQAQHQQSTGSNRQLLAAVNHGPPWVGASPRAGVFNGQGVTPANHATKFDRPAGNNNPVNNRNMGGNSTNNGSLNNSGHASNAISGNGSKNTMRMDRPSSAMRTDRPSNATNGDSWSKSNGNGSRNATRMDRPSNVMRADRPSHATSGEPLPKNNSPVYRGNNPHSGGGYGNPNNSHERNVYAPDNSHARAQEHHNAPHGDKNQNRGGGREQKEQKEHR